jgi:hypothetical protein
LRRVRHGIRLLAKGEIKAALTITVAGASGRRSPRSKAGGTVTIHRERSRLAAPIGKKAVAKAKATAKRKAFADAARRAARRRRYRRKRVEGGRQGEG